MNGQVEREIGIVAAKTRALLMDKKTPKKYWPLAMETATYLLNRMSHESLGGVAPLEKSMGEKPNLGKARVFGCKAYVQVPKAQRKGKLSNTAWTGMMVGYSTQSPEWIILDPRSKRLRSAYSVTFDEDIPGLEPEKHDNRRSEHTVEERHLVPTTESEPEAVQEFNNPGTSGDSTSSDTYSEAVQEFDNPGTPGNTDDSEEEIDKEVTCLQVQEDQLLSLALCAAATISSCNEEPKSWRKAISVPHWKEAMVREKKELEYMRAWELVPRSPGITVLPGGGDSG